MAKRPHSTARGAVIAGALAASALTVPAHATPAPTNQAHLNGLLREALNAKSKLFVQQSAYAALPACSRLIDLRAATDAFQVAVEDLLLAAEALL